MRYATIATLIGIAGARPVAIAQEEGKLIPPASNMVSTIAQLTNIKGELDAGLRPLVRDEVIDNTPCGKVVFIFARASKEPANMVRFLCE